LEKYDTKEKAKNDLLKTNEQVKMINEQMKEAKIKISKKLKKKEF